MSTQYVVLTENSREKELLDKLKNITKESGDDLGLEQIDPENGNEVLQKAIELSHLIFQQSIDDVYSIYAVFFSLIPELSPEMQRKIVNQLLGIFNSQSDTTIKITLLHSLYNSLPYNNCNRFQVYGSLFHQILETGLTSSLCLELDKIEKESKSWNLNQEQLRRFYFLLSEVSDSLSHSIKAHEYREKYLRTFQNVTNRTECKDIALKAAILAVKSETLTHCDDIVRLTPIIDLKKSHPPLFRILENLASGSVVDYLSEFMSESSTRPLIELGIDPNSVLEKLRIGTLCSLGIQQEKIPYDHLAVTLGLSSDEEIENFLIKSIHNGIFDAKIDQEKRILTIERTTQRSFYSQSNTQIQTTSTQKLMSTNDKKTWQELQKKVNQWSSDINSLLSLLSKDSNSNQTEK